MDQVLVDLFSYLEHPVFAWLFIFFIAPYFAALWYLGWLGLVAVLVLFGVLFTSLYGWRKKKAGRVAVLEILGLLLATQSILVICTLLLQLMVNRLV